MNVSLADRVAETITAMTGRLHGADATHRLAAWLDESEGNRRWALDWVSLAERHLAGATPAVTAQDEFSFRQRIEAAMGITTDDGGFEMVERQLRFSLHR